MTPADLYHKSMFAHLRAAFLRGIGVIIPLGLTYWFFRALLNWVDGILSPALESWIGRHIPGLGFTTMLVLILLVGLLTRNLLWRLFFAWFENLLCSIPFVRSVYSAVKDLVSAFATGGKGQTFRKVVMTEYPRKGLYAVGFVTNELRLATSGEAARPYYSVVFPNPPNPTSAFLILVPVDEAIVLDITVEEGLKLVLSGGIVTGSELIGHRASLDERTPQ
jgi:uncharacterized membrane protein